MATKKNEIQEREDFFAKVRIALADETIHGDGHTMFAPEFYAPHFSETELKKAKLIQTHKSVKGSHKETIYASDGSVIEKMVAIYNLSFLYWVCRKVGVSSATQYNGRGMIAQALVARISSAVNTTTATE